MIITWLPEGYLHKAERIEFPQLESPRRRQIYGTNIELLPEGIINRRGVIHASRNERGQLRRELSDLMDQVTGVHKKSNHARSTVFEEYCRPTRSGRIILPERLQLVKGEVFAYQHVERFDDRVDGFVREVSLSIT